MNKRLALGFGALCLMSSQAAAAQWTGGVTLTSDYLFNGVSQTQGDPALQFTATVSGESGAYAGVFASNVDFGDDTDLELDAYAGWYTDLQGGWHVEVSALYYSYHGASESSQLNYPEVMLAIGYQRLRLASWYSWDYFGTGARHIVSGLTYTHALANELEVQLGVVRSQSLDADDYQWDTSRSYDNAFVSFALPWRQVQLGATLSYASLGSDWYGGSRANVSVSYLF